MNRKISWMATLVVLGAMAAVAFAAMSSHGPVPSVRQAQAAAVPAVEHATCDRGADSGVIPAIATDEGVDLVEPAGICRMAPQCSENSDCDYLCGPGAGWCRHSKCPIRVCDCH